MGKIYSREGSEIIVVDSAPDIERLMVKYGYSVVGEVTAVPAEEVPQPEPVVEAEAPKKRAVAKKRVAKK